jgi:methyl-accepting chemotaxis protein
MLGNLSLRPKIALILLLPVAALLLLAGLRIGSSVSTSRQAAQVRGLTEFALRGTALAHELQRERGLSLGGLLAGEQSPRLRQQRATTNSALAAWRGNAANLDAGALAPATEAKLAEASNRLNGLTGLRRDVNRGSVTPAAALDFYNTTIAALLNTNRGLASGIADPQLAQRVGAFVAMSRIKELAALERELISEVLDRGRFGPGQFRRFTSTISTRAVLLAEFRTAADDAQRAIFVDTMISRLTVTAPARPQGEVRPGDHRHRWQALIEGAAAPWRLAVVEDEASVRLQRRVGRVVEAADRAICPVPNA